MGHPFKPGFEPRAMPVESTGWAAWNWKARVFAAGKSRVVQKKIFSDKKKPTMLNGGN
jgi:hypothetical protein